MKYDFLPLIEHTFAYGTEFIVPEFIVSNKAKEELIYPKAFSLLKHLMIITWKAVIRNFMKFVIY